MKISFSVGLLAALCHTAYSLESGRYTITSAIQSNPPLAPLGTNPKGEQHLLVLGGENKIFEFQSQHQQGVIFQISQSRYGSVNCRYGKCLVSHTGSQQVFLVREVEKDIYTITNTQRGSPLAWTLLGSGVRLEISPVNPLSNQKWRLAPVLEGEEN